MEGACIILLAVICAGTLAQAHPLWRAVKNIVSFWEMCQKSVVECRTAFICHLYEQIHLQIFVKKSWQSSISFGKNSWSICSICRKDILLLISVSYFLLLLDSNKLSDSRCRLSRVHVWICNVFARIWLKPVEETTYNINKSECIMSGGMNVWINLVINVTFILVLCFISC